MRAQILALSVVVMSVGGCSVDVRERDVGHRTLRGTIGSSERSRADMVVYPRARRVADVQTDPANVSFTGRFADTRVIPATFESDDAPAMVLAFYRSAMRAHRHVIECRGHILIRRSRRSEEPVCIERPESQVVQLATGSRSSYRLVAVEPRGTATEFTLVSVYVR